MEFDWQVALGTALTGIGEKTGQMYDDYQKEQRNIREENRQYQTEMRKANEKRRLEQQWKLEDDTAKRQRLESSGMYEPAEITSIMENVELPHSVQLEQAAATETAKVEASTAAKAAAIDNNPYLSEKQKADAHIAAVGIAPGAAEKKLAIVRGIVNKAERGPNGELMLSTEDKLLLQAMDVDLSKGGLKYDADNYVSVYNKVISGVDSELKDSPPSDDDLAAEKTRIALKLNKAAADVTDQEAKNSIRTNMINSRMKEAEGQLPGFGGNRTALQGPGGANPPPGGGEPSPGGLKVTKAQIDQIAAIPDQDAIKQYNALAVKIGKQGTSDPKVAKNGLLQVLAKGGSIPGTTLKEKLEAPKDEGPTWVQDAGGALKHAQGAKKREYDKYKPGKLTISDQPQ